jgi:uncharacterized NAD-dependent epimerase/dehydratase family protein
VTGEQPAPPETVSRSSGITTGQGGVFTEDVGVITGALTIRTDLTGTEVTVRVQYKDADEWYVVRGGHGKLADPADLDAVHGIVTGILDRPGDV